jgi:hypothetical protein
LLYVAADIEEVSITPNSASAYPFPDGGLADPLVAVLFECVCVAAGVLKIVPVAPETAITCQAELTADPMVYDTEVSAPVDTFVHTYPPRKSSPDDCNAHPDDSGRFDPVVSR